MSDHRMRFEWDRDSVTATLTCTAPEGADCRLIGADHCDCENWVIERADSPMATPFHRVPTFSGPDIIHWMHDGGHCNAVEWMDSGDTADFAEQGQEFLIAEVPVSLSWDDNGPLWERGAR